MMQKLVAVLLVVVCPATLLMAERPTAMLYASGSVTLNGIPAAKSSSVFAGDRIATADSSVVSINRNGSSLVLDPNSSVEYQNDGFTILKGIARVRMSKGLAAHAGPLSVIPKADAALFDISSDGKTILVASREGSLTLTDGVDTATLEPGYTARISVDPQDYQDQGPKPAAGTRGDEKKHKKLIIIILASAAAAAIIACILACGGGGTPVTPVTP
jgi:hypothetical protein